MGTVSILARHTLIYGLSSVVGRVINFALTPLYVNLFSPATYGIFSDLYALLAYPLVVLTFGLETALFRFGDAEVGGRRLSASQAYTNALVSVAALGAGAAALAALGSGWIARSLGYAERGDLIALLIGITLFDVWAAVPMARLRQRELAVRFAAISLTNIALTLGLNLLFLLVFRWGIEAVFWANLIASALRFLLALAGNLPDQWRPDGPTTRTMLHYGAYLMLAGLTGQLNEMLDKNLLPRLWPDGKVYAGRPRTGAEMNGIYAASYKLGMLLVLAGQAFRYAIEPFFLRQQPGDESAHRFAMARVFHYFMLAGIATVLLVSAFAPEIAAFDFWGLFGRRTFIPPSYRSGLVVVPLVLLANLSLAAYTSFGLWYKRTGQLRFGLLFAGAGVLLTLGINVVFIPHYGYLACAVAHLACYTAMAALCYVVGRYYYPVPYAMGRTLAYLGVALLTLLFMYLLGQGGRAQSADWWAWKAALATVVLFGCAFYELARPPFRS